MLAFGDEPWLEQSIASAFASGGADVEVVVVDNGTSADLTALAHRRPGVRVVGDGTNLGFAGGVNAGVLATSGEVIVLLNSDAVFIGDALPRLTGLAAPSGAGIVGALIVMGDDPAVVNSRGNPLHVLGLSWAGGIGSSTAEVPLQAEVASASGACLALRRDLWDELTGFDPLYFAYFEDMDLCWRCHQRGLPVRVRGDIRIAHHYEFSRNPLKVYLLERNRLLFLLTNFEARTLTALALPLVAMELALLLVAIRQGWGAEKRRGWAWLLQNRQAVGELRRRVQTARTVPDSSLYHLMVDTFDTAQVPIPGFATPLQAILRGYWSVARRLLTITARRGQVTRSSAATRTHPRKEDRQ